MNNRAINPKVILIRTFRIAANEPTAIKRKKTGLPITIRAGFRVSHSIVGLARSPKLRLRLGPMIKHLVIGRHDHA